MDNWYIYMYIYIYIHIYICMYIHIMSSHDKYLKYIPLSQVISNQVLYVTPSHIPILFPSVMLPTIARTFIQTCVSTFKQCCDFLKGCLENVGLLCIQYTKIRLAVTHGNGYICKVDVVWEHVFKVWFCFPNHPQEAVNVNMRFCANCIIRRLSASATELLQSRTKPSNYVDTFIIMILNSF